MPEIKASILCRSLDALFLQVTDEELFALRQMNDVGARVALAKMIAEYEDDEREGRWSERDEVFLGSESVDGFAELFKPETSRSFSDKDGLLKLPPEERTIIPPAEGWEANAYYSVAVSLRPNNPIFSAIFFSGFLNVQNGEPGGYNCLFNPTMEGDQPPIWEIHYLRVIRRLNHEVGEP